MKLCGIDNADDTRHFDIPMKSIRYLTVEKSSNDNPDRFFLKAVGFRDRISIKQETYKEIVEHLEKYLPTK